MSDFLLETGRQTLMLELQEASRLPERLGEDFVRAANTIIHCEGKVIVAASVNPAISAKRLPRRWPAPAPRRSSCTLPKRCTAIWE